MRRTQFSALPWLFLVVRDPHSRPKQAWAPELKPPPFVPAPNPTPMEELREQLRKLAWG